MFRAYAMLSLITTAEMFKWNATERNYYTSAGIPQQQVHIVYAVTLNTL